MTKRLTFDEDSLERSSFVPVQDTNVGPCWGLFSLIFYENFFLSRAEKYKAEMQQILVLKNKALPVQLKLKGRGS